MTGPDANNSTDFLRTAIESVADQLCAAVDGNFDFRVKVASSDQSIEKLQMLINFVLDAARRGIHEQQKLNDELRVTMMQLEQSCEDAEAANQAKSDFFANMSHELRTPLTAIMGFTDMLSESAASDQKEKLDVIHRNGEQLLSIIDDVLDLSSVESGEARMIVGDMEVVPLLLEITNGLAARAQQKQIELTCYTRTPIPCTVSTDSLRVRQILTNIIGNAVKFTARGWVRVEASFIAVPVNRLHIDIIDTGTGMDADDNQRIFDPFSQADSSVTREFGGTGLGLTISRQFAQMLGGDVKLISAKRGMGSHFRLELPCFADENTEFVELEGAGPDDAPGQPSSTAPTSSNSIEDLDLLLVEDGVDNQRLIKHILTKHGANVTTAENGQIALKTFEAARNNGRPFHVVLMDMQMPVMDGYTATRNLRSRGFDTPVIALTAHAMPGDREKCINAGCSDYATKPIKPKQLIELIATLAATNKATCTVAHPI